jgi:hypothetical protein
MKAVIVELNPSSPRESSTSMPSRKTRAASSSLAEMHHRRAARLDAVDLGGRASDLGDDPIRLLELLERLGVAATHREQGHAHVASSEHRDQPAGDEPLDPVDHRERFVDRHRPEVGHHGETGVDVVGTERVELDGALDDGLVDPACRVAFTREEGEDGLRDPGSCKRDVIPHRFELLADLDGRVPRALATVCVGSVWPSAVIARSSARSASTRSPVSAASSIAARACGRHAGEVMPMLLRPASRNGEAVGLG